MKQSWGVLAEPRGHGVTAAPPTEDEGDQHGGQDLGPDLELREAEVEFLSEARLDQEQAMRDAAALAMRTRALADVAFELMSRGDLLSVTIGDRSFTGRVIYAAGDLMTVQTEEPTVDFNLAAPVLISVTNRAREGGVAPGEGPGSFRGRLMEWERAPEPVELGLANPDRRVLKGEIRAAAEDHVAFVDTGGREWFVPATSVVYLARRPRR